MRIVITGAIAVAFLLVYTSQAEQGASLISNEGQVATAVTSLQSQQLVTALELYYLENGSYPTVTDDRVVQVLFDAALMQSSSVPFAISYQALHQGQNYTLALE